MILVVKEAAADWTISNGAVATLLVATLLDEPKVSLLIDDDDWALAKEEEINYRVVDEAVNNDDSNDDIKNQPLKSTNNVSIALLAAAGSKIWQYNPLSSWVDWQKVVIWGW